MNFKKIGIIGGGQLGKMMVLEGKKLGLHFTVLDPSMDCPAFSIVDEYIEGDFYDKDKIRKLAEATDLITYEFEHIDADILMELKEEGYKIYPTPSTLKIIQDKFQQKNFLRQCNVPVPDFDAVDSVEALDAAVDKYGLPLLLKSCRGGYDGKGNYLIRHREEIPKAYHTLGGDATQLMVEAFVPFIKEVSVVVARGVDGEIKVYPLAENIHENNILKTTIVPARVNKVVAHKAQALALKTMELLKGVGIFCVEMFVDADDDVLVNEIAPRTHNSGHYTIEACSTSQFAQHIRAILGLPLGETKLLKPAVMINLLGGDGYDGRAKLVGAEEILAIPEVYLHFYGKTYTQPERKMGHVTVLAEDVDSALSKGDKVKELMRIIAEE
ncbi:5-(carboxyamino)imidazole ribonucleotide synthase [Clostridium formicaceticum]|uniref:N5-carboxyaminoimidazole ribonucleotide synthase n=1 Tax=Clostridium formicaceticum TaxID=1497 RepID=A0AAC9RIF0_9CLOT|nr:5-(carboxyamino)imidazole ribonucleotide synthase [Clostridium formicaceticum]AOY75763.1 5-(carboxyamino)imidazole ribonucleotide synthase [Clostridium formicaceticum]ARE86087.1 N5-carboxyaminoimidazole ribonucleotide synthase [Clostridium formicaceticum]